MLRNEVKPGRRYAHGEQRGAQYILQGEPAYALCWRHIERVQVVEHIRLGKFFVCWIDDPQQRFSKVPASELISLWDERDAFWEGERQTADLRWAYIDKQSAINPVLDRWATSVRDQWVLTKDKYPDGYADAARQVLGSCGYSVPDEPKSFWNWLTPLIGGALLGGLVLFTWFVIIDQAVTGKLLSPAEVRYEVHWEIIAVVVGAVLGALLILMKRLTD